MNRPGFFSEEHPAYPFLVLINVIITTFLAVVSAVATVVANNSIQGELALSNTQAIWVTTLNLLGLNTTVPTANWFANRFGNKRVYTYGVLIFALSSAIVALSNHFVVLAAARFIEGVGAGFIFPIGLALIVQSMPRTKIVLAVNLYVAIAFGSGISLGALLSGYFSEFGSWRSLFFWMVPLGLAAAYSCWLSRSKKPPEEHYPFDYGGFFCFAMFIASLLVALTLGPIRSTDEGWRSWYIIALFVLAIISLIATLLIERRHSHPLIPLTLFKDPIYATSTIAMFLIGMAYFAGISVAINYMIDTLLYEKFVAGKIAAIYGVSLALATLVANVLIKWIPVPVFTFAGLSLLVYSYFLNNELSWLTGVDQVLWILFLRGAGLGLTLGPTTLLALYGVPKELKGAAATLLTFFRQVGITYGGTLLSILVIRQTIFHAARFGEQANNQLPAYRLTLQNLMNKFPDPIQAKGAIIQNIENQAYIQGLNDALVAFGYITGAVEILLLVAILYHVWKKRTKAVNS